MFLLLLLLTRFMNLSLMFDNMLSEDGTRNMKRKKSPLFSFIRKKLHDLSPMQTPDNGLDILPQFPEEGRLFGRPLVEICKNPETPKPIMVCFYHAFPALILIPTKGGAASSVSQCHFTENLLYFGPLLR